MVNRRKETIMMIELNKPFEGYTPTELLCGTECSYRQVYKAMDNEGAKVFLTVYDKDMMPSSLQYETIREFYIVNSLTNEIFPKYIKEGTAIIDGHSIAYMSTQYIEYITLRKAVEQQLLSEEGCLDIAYHLLIGLKELLYLTEGGGHFNICLDKVLLSKDNNGKYKAHLVGLNHAAKACCGKPNFDTKTLNQCSRSPESLLGRFSPATDVYAMGILMVHMLQRYYPLNINEYMSGVEVLNAIEDNKDNIGMPNAFMEIIVTCLNPVISNRFEDVEELGIALMSYMGLEKPQIFRCFSDKKGKHWKETIGKKAPKLTSKGFERKDNNVINSQEPHVNITIETRKGDGLKAVAGMVEIKKKLIRDFVDIVANKELAKVYDIQPPNMLFYGPPGTGKTYISMRLAEQCGLEFCAVKPSDLGSIWVHGSQLMVKELFEKAIDLAKKNKRGCLLLIDEFDSIAPKRTIDNRDHQAGEVAELLTQLNDCVEKNVYVIGTTNFLDRIDKAIIRKGRIDYVYFIGLPDLQCRKQIFELELMKRPHEENIDITALSQMTDGYTSSDIAYIVKEAARNTFEISLQSGSAFAVNISQDMLEYVIRHTKPSVSIDDARQYEKMRDEYIEKRGSERRRIGFFYKE